MIRRFLNLFRFAFAEKPRPLGRWGINSEIDMNIKSTLANFDSCGDSLCGDPIVSKHAIDKVMMHHKNEQSAISKIKK